ncbi:MAG TPA: glycosyltransferase family 2 protein [Gammaproteobacteria bacterium]
MSILKPALSIVLPANNEAVSLPRLLTELKTLFTDAEIIVVDDGSTDSTTQIAEQAGAHVLRHPYPTGNGAAIKSGARAARGETLIFMDADGQHSAEDAQRLLAKLEQGYDMVVGARDRASQASFGRNLANGFYNRLASWIVGHPIADLTSGFRAVKAAKFREFLYMLPNGFSYPTTITMAFFRAGYHLAYVPIVAHKRTGKSHIQPFQDGVRFLLIIFRIGTLYSPLKVFLPFSLAFFVTGLGHYLFTLYTTHRFTNMSALLFIASILVFLIGLVSEQITNLLYRPQA